MSRILKPFFRKPQSRRKQIRGVRGARHRRGFETLETRRLLANVIVTTGLDVVDPDDGEISLREAVSLANADPDTSTIRFDESLIDLNPSDEFNYSIELDSQLLISESVSIIGDDLARISVTGKDASRIFEYAAGANKQYQIEGLTLAHGNTLEAGGAILVNGGEFTMRKSVIRDSQANGGGALLADFGAVVRVDQSSIVNNQGNFGTALNLQSVDVVISNSTISGNMSSGDSGVGILLLSSGTGAESSLTLIHTTVANNGGQGGNISNNTQLGATSATVEILNSIIAQPNGGTNVSSSGNGATQLSLGGNVIDDNSGVIDVSLGDLRADPMLNALTFDIASGQYVHQLPQGSPAIDAGIDAGRAEHAVDQTGQRRFLPDSYDAGAWERRTVTVTTTEDTVDSTDNVVSLREAVTFTNTQQNIRTIEFSPDLDGQTITLTRNGSGDNMNATGDIDFQIGDVTLLGNGRDNTIISGGGDSGIGESVFHVISAANVTLQGLTIRDGRATSDQLVGGAIVDQTNSSGSLTLRDVRLTENKASNDGGAIVVATGSNTTIINSTIDNNSAARGGAIATFGELTIIGSTLQGNTASANGGAVQAQDALAVVRIHSSTLNGNESGFAGGAVSNVRGNVTVVNSTLSGNGADVLGGAVFTVGNIESASATTVISHATITDNVTRGAGSGVVHAQSESFNVPTTVTIDNSILIGNDGAQAPNNITFSNLIGGSGVSVNSAGNNLFDDNAFGIGVSSDQLNVSVPVIDSALRDNGGPTRTHALANGSPAIDAGTIGSLGTGDLITPVNVVTNTIDDFQSVSTLLDAGALTVSDYENFSGAFNWITDDVNGFTGNDYFANDTPDPVLVFDLGQISLLTDVAIWGHNQENNNDVKDFTLEFSNDGGVSYTKSIPFTKPRFPDSDLVQTFALPSIVSANFVRMTITDNYFGEPNGLGGDRVALGEVRFLSRMLDQRGLARAPTAIDIGAFEVDQRALDFGDAPSSTQSGFASSYPVTLADDGARHAAGGDLFFGNLVDFESDGLPDANAGQSGTGGDDNDNQSDEDGVFVLTDAVASTGSANTAAFLVNASATGLVNGWIDFNQDGDWDDDGERIFTNVSVQAGSNLLAYQIPAGASVGSTGARFRISTAPLAGPTGLAVDGEVEDYIAVILDGSAAPPVEIFSPGAANSLTVDNSLTTFDSDGLDLFVANNDQLGTIQYQPLPSPETFVFQLAEDLTLTADRIAFGAFTGGSIIGVAGINASVDLTNPTTQAASGRVQIDVSHPTSSSIIVNAALAAKWAPGDAAMRVTLRDKDRLVVRNPKDWRMAEPITNAFGFQLIASTITGTTASLEVDTNRPWQNFLQVGDTDNNGTVSAFDALRIISELELRRYSASPSGLLMDAADVTEWPNTYYDVTGDGIVSALDALQVINLLIFEDTTDETLPVSTPSQTSLPPASVVQTRFAHGERDEVFVNYPERLPLKTNAAANQKTAALSPHLLITEEILSQEHVVASVDEFFEDSESPLSLTTIQ